MFSNASNDGVGTYLAEAGQLVPFACDSVICPAPEVSFLSDPSFPPLDTQTYIQYGIFQHLN